MVEPQCHQHHQHTDTLVSIHKWMVLRNGIGQSCGALFNSGIGFFFAKYLVGTVYRRFQQSQVVGSTQPASRIQQLLMKAEYFADSQCNHLASS